MRNEGAVYTKGRDVSNVNVSERGELHGQGTSASGQDRDPTEGQVTTRGSSVKCF